MYDGLLVVGEIRWLFATHHLGHRPRIRQLQSTHWRFVLVTDRLEACPTKKTGKSARPT